MDTKSLQTLEFDKIRLALATHTAFSASRELALALEPGPDAETINRLQEETAEARALFEQRASLTVGAAHDIRPVVERAARGGVLESRELLDVRDTLGAARSIRALLLRNATQAPTLLAIARRITPLSAVERAIEQAIGPNLEVLDRASTTLARVRQELRSAHDRVLDKLHGILNSTTGRQIAQEPIVTQRGNRFVIPIRSECKGQLPGLVLDTSSSGATLFFEPLSAVELNNRYIELQGEERREVDRVLRRLSADVGRWGDATVQTVAALAELDLAFARAQLAAAQRAVRPEMDREGIVRLEDARHPLLRGDVVPISVHLGDDFQILVITGPNTGGKTVALKTIGLLALMHQAGLQIPAGAGSRLPVFRDVFADIGDEQSIEQSLSTFSAHLRNTTRFLEAADPYTLVLLDELGAGTDPAEGSALARALLLDLLERGIPVVATTHHTELKSFAQTTPGVENASVEFDVETLSPTYHLIIGLPGRSNALAIASRLGVPERVLDRATELTTPEHREVERLLASIQSDQQSARTALKRVEAREREVNRLRNDLKRRLRQAEAERQRAASEAEQRVLRETEQIRSEIAELAAQLVEKPDRATIEGARAKVQDIEQRVRDRLAEQPPPVRTPQRVRPVRSGDVVWVKSFSRAGQVLSVSDDDSWIDVQLGSFKARVRREDLERIGKSQLPEPPAVTIRRAESPAVEASFDVRGRYVDEALPELERYLNDAYLAGLDFVRLIHGKGTGALRQGIHEALRRSPLVRNFELAAPEEGGDGVTVAHLAR